MSEVESVLWQPRYVRLLLQAKGLQKFCESIGAQETTQWNRDSSKTSSAQFSRHKAKLTHTSSWNQNS